MNIKNGKSTYINENKRIKFHERMSSDVAIIGMACRFPGAQDYEEFFHNLENGINSVKEIPEERLNSIKYSSNSKERKVYDDGISKYCGVLDDIDKFDNEFFNISPREAINMDPQQRILLEEAWHCVEDSGVALSRLQQKSTSVYIGVTGNDYSLLALTEGNNIDKYASMGNFECILSNRISYSLGLNGASLSIDAACASSLVTIHEAKNSLLAGESDYSIAGGVCLAYHPWRYLSFSRSHMMSLDGQCKAFSKDANGFVQGEGVGVLLLQRLEDAIRDGNQIYGVIKGSAVNHGGSNHTMTAPKVHSQKEVITSALDNANINPETISYIETHGTGTALGDPIEIEALSQSFRQYTEKKQFCKVGSVKSNIGHLASAAGVAGVIKVLLMMKHRRMFKSLHVDEENPIINFQDSPFRVSKESEAWISKGKEPLRAGISAFGFGGVNCNIIVEEFFKHTYEKNNNEGKIFALSAKNDDGLKESLKSWRSLVNSHHYKMLDLEDICATLLTGREQNDYRFASIVYNKKQLKEIINESIEKEDFGYKNENKWCMQLGDPGVINKELLAHLKKFKIFRETLHDVFTRMKHKSNINNLLVDHYEDLETKDNETIYAFAISYAYASTLVELGLEPSFILGDHIGKWTGYVICKMIDIEDAVDLILGKSIISNVKLNEPIYPYYDLTTDELFMPNQFNGEYLKQLTKKMGFDNFSYNGDEDKHSTMDYYINKYESLKDNQFSFRRDIEEWNEELHPFGYNIFEMISCPKYRLPEDGFETEKVFLLTVIISALYKISKKWSLTETRLFENKYFYEIINLIVDGTLPKKEAVDLFFSEKTKLSKIAERLNELKLKKGKKKYECLREFYQDNLNRLHNDMVLPRELREEVLEQLYENVPCIQIGEVPKNIDNNNTCIKVRFEENNDLIFLQPIAKLWESGVNINWNKEYIEGSFNKTALPVYPFARETFWVQVAEEKPMYQSSLHHMIDTNISDLMRQRFIKTIKGHEFYISDHVVDGRKIMPAAAYLEMARAAGEFSLNKNVAKLSKIVIGSPLVYDNSDLEVYINLSPDEAAVNFDISSMVDQRERIHSQGTIVYDDTNERDKDKKVIDVERIKSRCDNYIPAKECYDYFEQLGIEYGDSLKCLKGLYETETDAISILELDKGELEEFKDFILHPSIIDGAFQSVIRLAGNKDSNSKIVYLPFSIEEVKIRGELKTTCYIYARIVGEGKEDAKESNRIDIDICDESGNVIISVKNFRARAYSRTTSISTANNKEILYYKDEIITESIENVDEDHDKFENTLIVGRSMDLFEQMANRYRNAGCDEKLFYAKLGADFKVLGVNRYEINQDENESYKNVIDRIYETAGSLENIIYFDDNVNGGEMNKDHSTKHIYSLLSLCQVLMGHKITDKIKIQYIYKTEEDHSQPNKTAISSFGRTIHLENSNIFIKSIGVSHTLWDKKCRPSVIDISLYEMDYFKGKAFEIYYGENNGIKRSVKTFKAFNPDNVTNVKPRLRKNGVYLITGGLGGLGLIFAEYLAKNYKAKLILIGKSELNSVRKERIQQIESLGSEVLYIKADLTSKDKTDEVVNEAKMRFGSINGVLHCAGILKDAFFINKDHEEMKEVLSPKIDGVVSIDQSTKGEDLDFFMMFSSIASILGSVGQCDYSYANGFMDAFTRTRERKNHPGKTITINWPLWSDGGMQLEDKYKEDLEINQGIYCIENQEGLLAFEKALSLDTNRLVVLKGEKEKIEKRFDSIHMEEEEKLKDSVQEKTYVIDDKAKLRAEELIKEMLSEELRMPTNKIDSYQSFDKYGIDSVMILDINKVIEDTFGETSKTLLFEYQNVASLAEHFLEKYPNRFSDEISESKGTPEEVIDEYIEKNHVKTKNERFYMQEGKDTKNKIESNLVDDVAIIGVSGRYPDAEDLDELWENLIHGKDCITEIPMDRWEHDKYFNGNKGKKGKYYSKWGGFIKDADKFDPLFFNISPREAELMDPQERIFLESVWQTIEDAGYTTNGLEGSNVGVFAGVMYGNYSFVAHEETLKNNPTSVGLSNASIANRISYFFDFNGPSITLDTMCSSSITTIHLACESIKRGECDFAIAGGVNLSLHPSKYVFLSQGNFMSTDGRCRSFGDGGDGYVPGEGVGTVMLKPLQKAIKDKDIIYGVIKASSVNHGGKTSGFTVPNPVAQAELISNSFKKAGINPKTIGYIEAHGTGTSLGDPIEITGLTKVFEEYTWDKQTCAIGSIKSNIGHLESAAGIAALTKVLLQMKHKLLVPSIHSEKLNSNIEFEDTPFYVQRELSQWNQRTIVEDDKEISYPRRASISAFGAGGANGHLIVEEYVPSQETSCGVESSMNLFILSAETEDSLKLRAKNLIEYLNDRIKQEVSKEDAQYMLQCMSYTLQMGREAMKERLAIIASTQDELMSKLKDYYYEGKVDTPGVYVGGERWNLESLLSSNSSEDRDYIHSLMINGKVEKIAKIWVRGTDIDWSILYGENKPSKLSLPGYPFTKQRYWIQQDSSKRHNFGNKQAGETLHPLLDANVSTIFEQCYKKKIHKDEYIVRDHLVSNRNIIAGAVQVEMARIAGASATGKNINALSNIMLVEPIIVDNESEEVFIGITPNNSKLDYEIYSKKDSQRIIHSKGKMAWADFEKQLPPENINLQGIKERCQNYKEKNEIYETFNEGGLQYGDSFTAIEEVHFAEYEALSYIELPESLQEDYHEYVLHPSILDAAFGTIMSIGEHSRGIKEGVRVPFSIDGIEISGEIPQRCYAHAILNSSSGDLKKYDVTIMDELGNILVYINNFTSRIIENKEKPSMEEDIAYFESVYKKIPVDKIREINTDDIIMIFENEDAYFEKLVDFNCKLIKVRTGDQFRILGDDLFEINPEDEEGYFKLIETLSKEDKMPTYILHTLNLFDQDDYYRWDKYDEDHLKLQLEKGVLSVLGMFKAITQQELHGNIRLLYLYDGLEEGINPWHGMNNGFGNSITTLNHRFELVTIQLDGDQDLPRIILDEMTNRNNANRNAIRYVNGDRYVMTIEQLEKNAIVNDMDIPLKNEGVYLITGGLGKIGRTFAQYLAYNYKAKIALTGRSTLKEDDKDWIKKLEDVGAQITYIKGDISVYKDAKRILDRTQSTLGTIHGVFHCAGVATNTLATKVNKEEFEEALAAKVYGTVNIDRLLQEMDIGFLVLFSSISSIMGDFGVGSYAVGNSFMDIYARYRNSLKKKGLRKGKTLSIDWPLWKDGGMDIPENERSLYFDYSGLSELKEEQGIKVFEDAIRSEKNQIIVSVGNTQRVRKALKVDSGKTIAAPSTVTSSSKESIEVRSDENVFYGKMEEYLKEILSRIIKLPKNQISTQKDLEEYGIDSIMIMEFNEQLEKDFEDIPSTLLFEYKNLHDLAGYFVKNHQDCLRRVLNIEVNEKSNNSDENKIHEKRTSIRPPERILSEARFSNMSISNQANNKLDGIEDRDEDDQIAIIGISGRYPMAENLEELWANMLNSKDCISEIPMDRWDYRKYYDEKGIKGKIYSKWGGFLNSIEMFDPLFFNISPKEAELMDPQERLFLQTAWNSIEDAGYKKSDLSGERVGVFVGAMYGHYQMISSELSPNEKSGVASSFFSSIANRVSYFMNFTGPSLAIDTACSSSLEAIRLACNSIKDGTCEMAIAGGVNLTLHPEKYLFLCESNFLSTDGRCRSFGKGGDGYVPGEGVGAVILKPLKKAIEDRDNVYAIIKSAVVNHDGKTNGYSVPNPNAQSELIQRAIKMANIDPRSIGYIEAHGTGTALGDPIEVTGLVNAFSEYKMDTQSCPIGSIKSNIGHLESAAGIVALTKVILQMKKKMLVPSIHSQVLNENIDFDKTPFYVQREVEEWEPIIETLNGSQIEYPRRAGISAFGAGGTNVHMILEEYKDELEKIEENNDAHVIVLSAKDESSLKKYASELSSYVNKNSINVQSKRKTTYGTRLELEKLTGALRKYLGDILQIDDEKIKDEDVLQELYMDTMQLTRFVSMINSNFDINITTLDIRQCYLIKDLGKYIFHNYKRETTKGNRCEEKHDFPDEGLRLKDIAFTLQNGREPKEERLAMIVESTKGLCEKLDAYVAGIEKQDKFFVNNIKKVEIQRELFDGGMEWQEFIGNVISTGDLSRLTYLWSIGFDVEWNKLSMPKDVRRISLPTYPFLEEYCWLTDERNRKEPVQDKDEKTQHPDLEDNSEDDTAMLEILEMLQRGEVDVEDVDKLLEVDMDAGETTDD